MQWYLLGFGSGFTTHSQRPEVTLQNSSLGQLLGYLGLDAAARPIERNWHRSFADQFF
jgi:hypothetical protein